MPFVRSIGITLIAVTGSGLYCSAILAKTTNSDLVFRFVDSVQNKRREDALSLIYPEVVVRAGVYVLAVNHLPDVKTLSADDFVGRVFDCRLESLRQLGSIRAPFDVTWDCGELTGSRGERIKHSIRATFDVSGSRLKVFDVEDLGLTLILPPPLPTVFPNAPSDH